MINCTFKLWNFFLNSLKKFLQIYLVMCFLLEFNWPWFPYLHYLITLFEKYWLSITMFFLWTFMHHAFILTFLYTSGIIALTIYVDVNNFSFLFITFSTMNVQKKNKNEIRKRRRRRKFLICMSCPVLFRSVVMIRRINIFIWFDIHVQLYTNNETFWPAK